MNVETLFKSAGSDAKGQYTTPTAGSTEWNQWLGWANEELQVFGEVHDWPELTNLNYATSISASSTSVALVSNFKKMAGYLYLGGTKYDEVSADLFPQYENTSKVFRTGYNNGWFAEWKSAPTSDTSLLTSFHMYPSSLATTTDQIIMRNPIYLVKRLKTRIFKYRQDPIFTEIETEADLMLSQMIENEYYKHSQYTYGNVTAEQEAGFVLGED